MPECPPAIDSLDREVAGVRVRLRKAARIEPLQREQEGPRIRAEAHALRHDADRHVSGFRDEAGARHVSLWPRLAGLGAASSMAQWRGARFRALKKFAEARKKPWTDFDTQLDFFNEERKGRSAAERNWHNETDIGRGNRTGKMFEGYAGGLQAQRERHARGLLGAWRRGGVPVPSETGVASTHRYDGTDFDATRQGMAGRPEKSFVPSMDDASSSMMSKAIRAGMIGKQQHEVNGSLGVTIDSTGAPGTSVRAKASDIFKSVELRRGRSMAMASEDD